jgi:hypothetical protein
MGYFPYQRYEHRHDAALTADIANKGLGVTPPEREAMVNGSMFGWDIPAATVEENQDAVPLAEIYLPEGVV